MTQIESLTKKAFAALAGLSRHEEALVSYERAIALDADFAEAHYNRGVTLAALGKPEAALESYQRAIALKPDHAAAAESRSYPAALRVRNAQVSPYLAR
jgi:tetratricopeptide (TPR) repeat protein